MNRIVFPVLFLLTANSAFGQLMNNGNLSGNFSMTGQYYFADSAIGAEIPEEKFSCHSYMNLLYTHGKFSGGIRAEGNLNTMPGFYNQNQQNDGFGFPYKFISYTDTNFSVTAGSFYEQYGSGIILRTYEEKSLLYDNALEGIRLKYQPFRGIYLKGLVACQRKYFDLGKGIIRGFDGEVVLSQLIDKDPGFNIIAGGSFVSKYEKDNNSLLKLPANVAVYGGRLNLIWKNINIFSELAWKINDPSLDNDYIYKDGKALVLNATFSGKGLGLEIACHYIDNFSFRSERDASFYECYINSIPEISQKHTYTLASKYPYASQPNGETGLCASASYTFRKNTLPGGKYGTTLSLNYTQVNNIQKQYAVNPDSVFGTEGYSSKFLQPDEIVFFRETGAGVEKKINKNVKLEIKYLFQEYNYALLREGMTDGASTAYLDSTFNLQKGMVTSNIFIADLTIRFSDKHSIRFELEELMTSQDEKDWIYGAIELNLKRMVFITLTDNYNYGSTGEHYYSLYLTVAKNSGRLSIGYGRQNEGVYCIGGVCRYLSATNGFSFTVSKTF